MNLKIIPSHPVGTVEAPPSKSMAHRTLICAALAKGESVIKNVALSEDILATLDCLETLGAKINKKGNEVYVTGIENIKNPVVLNCRESGSTLRFLIPVSVTGENTASFCGYGRLMQRPMSEYEKLLPVHGVKYEKNGNIISVSGKLESGEFILDGDVSSQFVSGLLFALPLLEGDSRISLENKIESRSYINMTLQCLNSFGIEAGWENEKTLFVKSGRYLHGEHIVEGDYSNAAFFLALGDDVKVTGLDANSIQGDRIFKDIFEKIKGGKTTVDISDCPDLGPVLFVTAAMNDGAVFTGAGRLRIKESDRLECMKEELEKCGVKMIVRGNEAEILKSRPVMPTTPIDCHNDHRIAMAMAVLMTRTGGTLEKCECVKKSLPDFFDRLKQLNVKVIDL